MRRIVRSPKRVEEGVAPNTIAVMQPGGYKRPYEIWAMYQKVGSKLRVITTWRYPGVSPVRKQIPIPANILLELIESGDLKTI